MTDKAISGEVSFGVDEPWRDTLSKVAGNASPPRVRVSVISEAVGQLVSWLSLRNTNFSGRPVFLFASDLELEEGVPAGATVQLEAEITDETAESFVFSGRAIYEGRTVAALRDCGGYPLPLGGLEEPEGGRERFRTLTSGGIPANPGGEPFALASLIDDVSECIPGQKIIASKTFQPRERFYADHFPRFPVTPIVVINEMIGEATKQMMQRENSTVKIMASAIKDLKIKSFIKPHDQALVSVQKIEDDGVFFETIAEIKLGDRRILRGRYRYKRT